MLEGGGDLVFELGAVDRLTSTTGAGGITGLDHEAGNNAVEDYFVVVSALGEGCEVLACARGVVVVELDDDGALAAC